MKILITGAAGFIGFHLAKKLLKTDFEVFGLDNINSYYTTKLKYDRLSQLGILKDSIEKNIIIQSQNSNFKFVQSDLCDKDYIFNLFKDQKFDIVINLAAQAGVRFSIDQPYTYLQSNLEGFLNILEGCRHNQVKHLIFASSSSVYGNNKKTPFSTNDNVDHPISLYAATKKSNELMAHTYSHLYNIPSTGLRFFTVYGPWGRPDMAYYKFTKAIIEGKSIDVYNNGDMYRDFTYIDDIIEGIIRLINRESFRTGKVFGDGSAEYKIYNIGNSQPESLGAFISFIEDAVGKNALINYKEMQPGDVYKTYADVSDLEREIGYKPSTPLKEGIKKFVDWYKIWAE